MSTCRNCYEVLTPNGRAVTLCPLHAQAEGMREFVRRVAYMRRPRLSTNRGDLLESLTAQARALLRAVEGK